jgi:hypothetical protein
VIFQNIWNPETPCRPQYGEIIVSTTNRYCEGGGRFYAARRQFQNTPPPPSDCEPKGESHVEVKVANKSFFGRVTMLDCVVAFGFLVRLWG